jgi:hypothetical protein
MRLEIQFQAWNRHNNMVLQFSTLSLHDGMWINERKVYNKMTTKNTRLSQQFQNQISKSCKEEKLKPLTHNVMHDQSPSWFITES